VDGPTFQKVVVVCPKSTRFTLEGHIDSEVIMIERFPKETTRPMETETSTPLYEPPRVVSYGDAVQRTMGDEGPYAEKKAISGILGSSD
jgi:hypothetical protein